MVKGSIPAFMPLQEFISSFMGHAQVTETEAYMPPDKWWEFLEKSKYNS